MKPQITGAWVLLEHGIKGHGEMNVIMIHNTLSYGHTPTYQISLTKTYGPDKVRWEQSEEGERGGEEEQSILKQYISLLSKVWHSSAIKQVKTLKWLKFVLFTISMNTCILRITHVDIWYLKVNDVIKAEKKPELCASCQRIRR